MLQFSVYLRHCASGENASVHVARVEGMIPEQGMVSILVITDKQYSAMTTFYGGDRHLDRSSPAQLEMF